MMKIASDLIGKFRREIFEHLQRGSDGCWKKGVEADRAIIFEFDRKIKLVFRIPKEMTFIIVYAEGLVKLCMIRPIRYVNGSLTQTRYINPRNVRVLDGDNSGLDLFSFIHNVLENLKFLGIDRETLEIFLSEIKEDRFYTNLHSLEIMVGISFYIENHQVTDIVLNGAYYCRLKYFVEDGKLAWLSDSGTIGSGSYLQEQKRFIGIHTHPLKDKSLVSDVLGISPGDRRLLEADCMDLHIIFARISDDELRGRISALDEAGNVLVQDISLTRRRGEIEFKKHRILSNSLTTGRSGKVGVDLSGSVELYSLSPGLLLRLLWRLVGPAIRKLRKFCGSILSPPIVKFLSLLAAGRRNGFFRRALAGFLLAVFLFTGCASPSKRYGNGMDGSVVITQRQESVRDFKRLLKELSQSTSLEAIQAILLALDKLRDGLQEDRDATDYAREIKVYTQVMTLYPDNYMLYCNRGYAYIDLERYEEAVKDYSRAIELNPKYANAYFHRGAAYFHLGRQQDTITDFSKVIELKPQSSGAYNNRGIVYCSLQNDKRAIVDFNHAIELNPQYTNVYYNRGFAYFHLGRYEEAITDYNKAIKLNPQYADAYYNRGVSYGELGMYLSAMADYTKVIELNPENSDAYTQRGFIYYNERRKYKEAIADLTKAIKFNPQDAVVYYNRGIIYGGLQNDKRAIADLTKAIELDPQYALAYYKRGIIYSNLLRYQDAITDFSKVIELNPENSDAYTLRGGVYYKMQKYEESILDCAKALQFNPDDNFARDYIYTIINSTEFRKERLVEVNEEVTEIYQKAINEAIAIADKNMLTTLQRNPLITTKQKEAIEEKLTAIKTDKEKHVSTVFRLAESGEPEAIGHLIGILSDSVNNSSDIRAYAAYNLGRFQDAKVSEALIEATFDSDINVRCASICALGNIGSPETFNIFVEGLKDKLPSIRAVCISALSQKINEDEKTLNLIIEFLAGEQDNEIKLACINGLAMTGFQDSRIKESVAKFTDDTDWRLRQAAILALGVYSDTKTINKIMLRLNDDKEEVRQTAVLVAADKLKDNPGLFSHLYQKLEDPSQVVSSAVAMGLAPYIAEYSQLEAPLRQMLKEGDLATRQKILLGLGSSGSSVAIEIIKPYLNDAESLVRQSAITAFVQIPEAPLMELRPYLDDTDGRVRLVTAQALGGSVAAQPSLVEPFVRLAKSDENIAVRSMATLGLAGINQPQAIGVIEANLKSPDWPLRQSAALAASKIDSPQLVPLLSGALKDEHPLVRAAAAYGLGNKIPQQPQIIESIKPLVNDPEWQPRLAAVDVLGRTSYPDIEQTLIPALKDNSVFVRESAVTNLGLKVHNNLQLIGPLADTLQHDSDSWIRQLAAYSLKTVQSPQIEQVRPLIQETVPEVKVAVISPGVDDFDPRTWGRDVTQDCTKDWALRKILELGGVKVIEHRWSGRMWEMPRVQRELDNTMAKALSIAGKDGLILNVGYSAGNIVNERLFAHIKPGVATSITQAIQEKRIKILTLASPSSYNFSKIDSDWKNIGSQYDPFYRISEIFNPNKFDRLYNYYPDLTNNISEVHSTYRDPRVISYIAHQVFPQLQMPQLDKMIMQQDINKWNYLPKRGDWPGQYDFGIRAPDNYYLNQRQFNIPQTPMIPSTPVMPSYSNPFGR